MNLIDRTARLSRELDLDRKRLGKLRQQIQTNLYETLPGELMSETVFKADELYQNAGKKVGAIPTLPTHRVGVPINGRAKAAMPMTGHRPPLRGSVRTQAPFPLKPFDPR
jgi:hypothetical protein